MKRFVEGEDPRRLDGALSGSLTGIQASPPMVAVTLGVNLQVESRHKAEAWRWSCLCQQRPQGLKRSVIFTGRIRIERISSVPSNSGAKAGTELASSSDSTVLGRFKPSIM